MQRLALPVLVGLGLFAVVAPSGATVRGTTDAGGRFVSGGIGVDEIAELQQERPRYALAILTAARGSGAFLADIHIRITDAHDGVVLETVMDGPWLFVDLPAGRYSIRASLGDRVQTSKLAFDGRGHRQETFYFDTHDEVAPSGTAVSTAGGS